MKSFFFLHHPHHAPAGRKERTSAEVPNHLQPFVVDRSNVVLDRTVAIIGGLLFTGLVFYVIPMMKELDKRRPTAPVLVTDAAVDAPEEFEVLDMEIPEPPVEPEENEPLEMADEDPGFALDIPLLEGGGGGGIMIRVPGTAGAAGDEDDFVNLNEVDQPPTPVTRMSPHYPRRLLSQRVEGRVIVRAVVNVDGSVTDLSVAETSGHRPLDDAAMEALERWKFKPALQNGEMVRAPVLQPFTFRVQ